MTDAERYLWNKLQLRQLDDCKFRRQSPIGPFIVDFVCFEKKLVVELDGPSHEKQKEYDARRTEWLEAQGFREVRFQNDDVMKRIDDVVALIRQALAQSPPTPTLPHKGGGGRVR